MPIFGPNVISWNQSLPNVLLIPYAGVKLTSNPSPVLALNLIEMKSDELLYVLLPYSARLAILVAPVSQLTSTCQPLDQRLSVA